MIRQVDSRIDVLRNGVKHTELNPTGGVSVSMSANSEIKSSMSGEFIVNEAVDWYQDEIRPVLIIDGKEHNCGVYGPATISYKTTENVKTVSVEAYDRCWLVQTHCTESLLHISAGVNYISAVKSLLSECGIALVIETATSETLRNDREDWEIGTDYLTIVNQLLDEINYNQLWFNADGYAILQPEEMITAANIERVYDSSDVKSLMKKDSSVEIDLFNSPNVFICVCSNPDDDSVMIARAENNNPISPLSITRRGKRIASFIKVDNIASQSALRDYANLVCQESMLIGEKISISTGVLPPVGLNAVVAISHEDVSGVCREIGWEMDLSAGGTMKHNLERVAIE